jgi:alkaline phosphatase D
LLGLRDFVLLGPECTLDVSTVLSGTRRVGVTLHILENGKITTDAAGGLTLNITGDLLIDVPAGPTGTNGISGNGGAGQAGRPITVNATGNIVLAGNGIVGAAITSNQTSGCGVGIGAGVITLLAGVAPPTDAGDITIHDGARVTVNSSACMGGEILIVTPSTGKFMNAGLVESSGGTSGTGAVQLRGGGPVTIKAGCDLTVASTGKVSSRGLAPGADLVHLEGCVVEVFGLVESTGGGVGMPNRPPNRCHGAVRDGKPMNATACVEVWASDRLVIAGTGPQRGEVNANTKSGRGGISWIDLFARGPIIITGAPTGGFAVHANGTAGTNDDGGLIQVATETSTITMSGRAVQADATSAGGEGGQVTVQADDEVTLHAAILSAQGDVGPGGGYGAGGLVDIQAVRGSVLWTTGAGDVRPTGSAVTNPALRGRILLTACRAVTVSGDPAQFPVIGMVIPPFPAIAERACGGTVIFPADVVLPASSCATACQACTAAGCQTCTIAITKACTVDATTTPFTVDFSGTVTNTSTVAVTVDVHDVSVEAVSPTCSPVPCQVTGFPRTLDPGKSFQYRDTYRSHSTDNQDTVTATGVTAHGDTCSATATATCGEGTGGRDGTLTHGPLIVHAGPHHLGIWLRTDAPSVVQIESPQGVFTAPVTTEASSDFTAAFTLEALTPDTPVGYRIVVDGVPGSWTTARTAPAPGAAADVQLAIFADAGSQNTDAPALAVAAALAPDFVLEIGDMPHSNTTTREAMAQKNYKQMRGPRPAPEGGKYGARFDAAFRVAQTPIYKTWDDHDGCGINNSTSRCAYWPAAFQVRGEYHPLPPGSDWPRSIYHSVGWGRHLRVFLLDTRSRREPGWPSVRSMLGAAQKARFLDEIQRASETWKIVVSSVSFRRWCSKDDDTWQGYLVERQAIIDALVGAGVRNVVIVSGDIHTGGAIDAGGTADEPWPEMSVPMTASGYPANTGCSGLSWSVGRHPLYRPGFGWIEADGTRLIMEVYGEDGALRLRHTIPAR